MDVKKKRLAWQRIPQKPCLISIFAFRNRMKKRILFFLFTVVFLSCSKETRNPDTDLNPVEIGTLSINVLSYDSLGELENDFSGIKVDLNNANRTATTNSNGNVVFNDLTYGEVLPKLEKQFYESPELKVDLKTSFLDLNLFCSKFSAYKIENLNVKVFSADSITLSFNLNKPIPAGKVCKIAVLFSDTSFFSPDNFKSADVVAINNQSVQRINVAKLSSIGAALALLPNNKTFYLNAVPVSYGIYYSNLYQKKMLIGRNLYPPKNIELNKTWQ